MSFAHAITRLPLCDPADLLRGRALIVIAPHPDDESLGCGALLAWAALHQVPAHVVFLTNGEQSHPGSKRDVGGIRRAEAMDACACLGIAADHLRFLGLPDTGLGMLADDARTQAVQWLKEFVAAQGACLVAVTAPTDPHGDHQAAFAMVNQAAAALPDARLMSYPVWTWLNAENITALAGVRIRVDDRQQAKRQAIAAYASQHGRLRLDVDGFTLPPELLKHADADFEILLSTEL